MEIYINKANLEKLLRFQLLILFPLFYNACLDLSYSFIYCLNILLSINVIHRVPPKHKYKAHIHSIKFPNHIKNPTRINNQPHPPLPSSSSVELHQLKGGIELGVGRCRLGQPRHLLQCHHSAPFINHEPHPHHLLGRPQLVLLPATHVVRLKHIHHAPNLLLHAVQPLLLLRDQQHHRVVDQVRTSH